MCCKPGPPVIAFDPSGNVVTSWGGPGQGYDWPSGEDGIHVDYRGNVWISGQGGAVLKFTKDGKFLMQIGKKEAGKGSQDTTAFNRATDIQVSRETNEVFISDGYNNRRVIVFDADKGTFKRMWSAFGNKPDDTPPGGLVPRGAVPWQKITSPMDGPSPKQFTLVHGVRLSNDGMIYVADRLNNRVQAFKLDGTFVNEGYTRKETQGNGSAYDVDLSADPQQRFVYVGDGWNNVVWIMDRKSLKVLGHFGHQGRMAGQFHHTHTITVDTKGNLYTGETEGHRVQKFIYKGLSKTGGK
jgi:hypothetical protein